MDDLTNQLNKIINDTGSASCTIGNSMKKIGKRVYLKEENLSIEKEK